MVAAGMFVGTVVRAETVVVEGDVAEATLAPAWDGAGAVEGSAVGRKSNGSGSAAGSVVTVRLGVDPGAGAGGSGKAGAANTVTWSWGAGVRA
jgi:hypothetical protein